MKKRSKISLCICGMVVIIGAALVGYPKYNSMKKEVSEEKLTNEVVASVIKGNIAQKYTTKGQVISQTPETYVSKLEFRGANEKNLHMIKNKGEDIAKKEALCTINGRKRFVDFNGKILDVSYNNDESGNYAQVSLLNYDNLYINTRIDEKELSEINHQTKVNIIHDGKTYEGKINLINYEIENGEVLVQIKVEDCKLYPGTDVYVDFIKEAKEDKIYLPEKAIVKECGNTYAILLQEGKENKQVEIKTGETFYEKVEDQEEAFVEVVSGLKEGDLVIINQDKAELNMEDL